VSRIAIRYSKALFEFAVEKKKLTEVEEDLNSINDLILSSEEFRSFIVNPLVPARTKTEAFKKLFANKIDDITLRFLVLLSTKKRSDFLPDVINKFHERALEYKGVLSAHLYTAVPLEEKQRDRIKTRLEKSTGKTVHLTEIIEKSLIGGIIIKIRDSVIDYSLKRQLEILREKMIYG